MEVKSFYRLRRRRSMVMIKVRDKTAPRKPRNTSL